MSARKSKADRVDFTERVDRWIRCKDPVMAGQRGKRPQIANGAGCDLTMKVDQAMFFCDLPQGSAPSAASNGKASKNAGSKGRKKPGRRTAVSRKK